MPVSPEIVAAIKSEFSRLEEDCTHSGKAHFNAGDRWRFYNYILGIPSVMLSALSGAAFFKDYPVAAGLMTAAVTVLTALVTFLKPSEVSNSHKNSGDQYLALRNDARVFREIQLSLVSDEQSAIESISSFTTRRNELNQASRQFSTEDFNKAKAGIDKGQAEHAVDRGN